MAIIDFKATKCRHCYKCVRYGKGRPGGDYTGKLYFVRPLPSDLSSVSQDSGQ